MIILLSLINIEIIYLLRKHHTKNVSVTKKSLTYKPTAIFLSPLLDPKYKSPSLQTIQPQPQQSLNQKNQPTKPNSTLSGAFPLPSLTSSIYKPPSNNIQRPLSEDRHLVFPPNLQPLQGHPKSSVHKTPPSIYNKYKNEMRYVFPSSQTRIDDDDRPNWSGIDRLALSKPNPCEGYHNFFSKDGQRAGSSMMTNRNQQRTRESPKNRKSKKRSPRKSFVH